MSASIPASVGSGVLVVGDVLVVEVPGVEGVVATLGTVPSSDASGMVGGPQATNIHGNRYGRRVDEQGMSGLGWRSVQDEG